MLSAAYHDLHARTVCPTSTAPQPSASPTTTKTVVSTVIAISHSKIMQALMARGTRLAVESFTKIASRERSFIPGTESLKV